MLENLVYDAMAIIGLLLMALGVKILLIPMPSCGLGFVFGKKIVSQTQIAHLAIGLEYKKEVAQFVHKEKWLIDANKEIAAFYQNLYINFSNARWWELF